MWLDQVLSLQIVRKCDCFWLPTPTWASTPAGAISLKVISLSHFLTFCKKRTSLGWLEFVKLENYFLELSCFKGWIFLLVGNQKDVKCIGWILTFRRIHPLVCILINVGFYYNQFTNFDAVLMSFRQVEKSSQNKQHDGSKC